MSNMLQESHPFSKTPNAPRLLFDKPIARPGLEKTVGPATDDGSSPKREVFLTSGQTPALEIANTQHSKKTSPKLLSEFRIGMMVHDEGPFSRNKESGIDTNFEFLFNSLPIMDVIYSLRPHIGGTINSAGNTSQAYLGITWGWNFFRNAFLNFSLGGAYHNGESETSDLNKKSLGCSTLFRQSLDLGYQITGPHAIMLHLDHISNAKICSTNEGLETFGVRYGYRF